MEYNDIKRRIMQVLEDYIDDVETRNGVFLNVMHYVWKCNKRFAIGGFLVGIVFTMIMLKWLA
jgi:hypothetical protein